MINLDTENGAHPLYLAATASTSSTATSVIAILDAVLNRGPDDITFTFTRVDGGTVAVVLGDGDIYEAPWLFTKVAYITATYDTPFKMWMTTAPKKVQ